VGDPRVRFLVAAEPIPAPPTRRAADAASVAAPDIVVGYVVAWVVADEAEIANLAVTQERRRSGIGRRLLEAAASEAEVAGARMVYLEVRESNAAARALYGSGGFTLVGRRSRYYRNPSEDALVLRLDLHGALAGL
jgi:ribosomal-protein-alanine N-acetyltransferase